MNRNGQTIFLSIVVGIFLFLFGILFLGFIQGEVEVTQNSTSNLFPDGASNGPGLNCGTSADPNLSISDGNKLSCLATELVVPYFIILIFSLAGASITARFLSR